MEMDLGQAVKSLAGRDRGKTYLIIGFNADGRALLADGRVRTIDKPKKRNIKHLQPYRCVLPEIKEGIKQGDLNNQTVRNALNKLYLKENDNMCDSPCLRSFLANG